MTFFETRATAIVTIATLIVSGIVLFGGNLAEAAVNAGFIPLRVASVAMPADHGFVVPVWATPLTATLLHGGIAHIALNLVMLVYCGQQTERVVGAPGFVLLYVVGAYAAAAGQWALGPTSVTPMIGASGAISAVVAAYALFYGTNRARSVGPVSANILHVAWLAAAWIGIQLMIGLAGFGGSQPVAIGAHIGGFVAGLILARPLLLWRYRTA